MKLIHIEDKSARRRRAAVRLIKVAVASYAIAVLINKLQETNKKD
jgi:hypothetical protein